MNNVLAGYLYLHGFEDITLETAQQIDECLEFLYVRINENITDSSTEEDIQYWFYEAGKVHFSHDLRLWFRVVYQLLMGTDSGPRLGQFTKIRGVEEVLNVIYNVRMNDVFMDRLIAFRRNNVEA